MHCCLTCRSVNAGPALAAGSDLSNLQRFSSESTVFPLWAPVQLDSSPWSPIQCVPITVTILTDAAPLATAWRVLRLSDGVTILSGTETNTSTRYCGPRGQVRASFTRMSL